MSEFKLIILIKARKEFITAFNWYEEQKDGLGDKFSLEIEQSLNLIRKNPNHYPSKTDHLKEFVVKKYPFIITYKMKRSAKEIIIASIFYTKRNPKLK